jgi:DNA-binding response OmpR family regulator
MRQEWPAAAAGGQQVLLTDDQPAMRQFIARALAAAGYGVRTAASGADALRLASGQRFGLVILDLVMPDMDGRAVLAALLRARAGLPVLVLSCLDDTETKVTCLELGAHDYLTKPFSLAELLARVAVQFRDTSGRDEVLQAGEVILHLSRLEADSGHGPVALTRLEFLLLRELMAHAGEPVGKDHLLASIWGYDFPPGSNVVDVCVRRLRSKLGFDTIRTERRAGYRLAS